MAKKHKITFHYYDDYGDSTAVIADYVRYIKDDSHKYFSSQKLSDWSTHDLCGGGCRPEDVDDTMCHGYCNSLACNYDNGHCEIDEREGLCYNGDTSIADDSLEVCSMYKSKSCCTNMDDIRVIEERFKEFDTGACSVDKDCLDNIKAALCAYCSPDNKEFIRSATVYYCSHFSEVIYSTCKDSYFYEGGRCVAFKDLFKNEASFIQQFGLVSSNDDNCFNDLLVDPFPVWKIVVICVAAVLAVAIIVVVIVIVVVIRKKKKKQVADANLKTVDQAVVIDNGVGMVPLSPSLAYGDPAQMQTVDLGQQQSQQQSTDIFSNPESDVTYVQAFQ